MTRAAHGTSPRAKGNIHTGVPRLAWTVRELADALRVNYQTALRMVAGAPATAGKPAKEAELKSFMVGGEYRISVFEIARLVGVPPAELEQLLADLEAKRAA